MRGQLKKYGPVLSRLRENYYYYYRYNFYYYNNT
jgi:hypothetical protein